jgi:alpha-galactosidase
MNFSFVYDNIKYDLKNLTKIKTFENKTEYILDCLKITRTTVKRGDSISVLTEFKNISESNSKILEKIYDIDEIYSFTAPSLEYGYGGYGNDDYLYLIKTLGSNYDNKEFQPNYEALRNDSIRKFSCRGGRSSQGYAPFFELNLKESGVLFTIGWTGQWFAEVKKGEKDVSVKAGIENIHLYLKPGETIRSAEITTMSYNNGSINAHNDFKRMLKCLAPKNIDENGLPFFTAFWGGASSAFMLNQLQKIKQSNSLVECFWIDAGWYGDYKNHCYSEFSPEWGEQTGNWFVNKNIHPKNLEDVFKFSKEIGLKNLLWLEPERAIRGTVLTKEHPDWFFECKNENTLLFNLGNDEARNYITGLISEYIQKYKLDFYRQDFNMDPLPYWIEADNIDRQGISQIKHICGLYKMWDELLKRFPHLIIDNCASGGRRIDTETLKRSVPLWRSDYQCVFDADSETAQNHNMAFSQWIPYSCTGTGFNVIDKYHFRSCCSFGLNSNFFGYELKAPENYPLEIENYISEFKKLRKYFCQDYYPIFGFGDGHSAWGGWQFHNRDTNEGLIMAFRRDKSPCETVTIKLGAIEANKKYIFYGDLGEFVKDGSDIIENGLKINIEIARDSRIIFYNMY